MLVDAEKTRRRLKDRLTLHNTNMNNSGQRGRKTRGTISTNWCFLGNEVKIVYHAVLEKNKLLDFEMNSVQGVL